MIDNPNQILKDLVDGLNNTSWSSWQATAFFDEQLKRAEEYLEKLNDAD